MARFLAACLLHSFISNLAFEVSSSNSGGGGGGVGVVKLV